VFCPKCDTYLPERGDCPTCGEPRPDVNILAMGATVSRREVPPVTRRRLLGGMGVVIFFALAVGLAVCVWVLLQVLGFLGVIGQGAKYITGG
jgi:hypothetical protein